MKQGCKKVRLNHVSSCWGHQGCTVEVSPLHRAFLNPALTTTLPAGKADVFLPPPPALPSSLHPSALS